MRRNLPTFALLWLLIAMMPAPHARVVSGTMESEILGKSMDYRVFIPDASPAAGDRYPVIYFLPGLFSNPNRWFDRGGLAITARLIRDGSAQPFAVVVTDADNSFYVNTAGGGRYEDYFITEVVPYMQSHFPLRADREGRAVSGTSMGGYGAFKLGLKYPEMFGSVSAHSAFLLPVALEDMPEQYTRSGGYRAFTRAFGSPPDMELWKANDPWRLITAHKAEAFPPIYFDVGTEDRYRFFEGGQVMADKLTAAGITHEFHLNPGPHGWDYLRTVLADSMLFHDRHFRSHPPDGASATASGK